MTRRLNSTARALKRWNRDHFGYIHTRMHELKEQLSTSLVDGRETFNTTKINFGRTKYSKEKTEVNCEIKVNEIAVV